MQAEKYCGISDHTDLPYKIIESSNLYVLKRSF